MELHAVYEHLWVVGTDLQQPQALVILDDGHRPWPKLHPADVTCIGMCAGLSIGLRLRKAQLRKYRLRSDANEYEIMLRDVLRLFGEGIHESLTRTMSKCLNVTSGLIGNFTNAAVGERSCWCHQVPQ